MKSLTELLAELAAAPANKKAAIQLQIDAKKASRTNSLTAYAEKYVTSSLFYGSKEEQAINMQVVFNDDDTVKTKEVQASGNKKTQRIIAINIDTEKEITLPSLSELKKFSGESENFWNHCNYGQPFALKFTTIKSGEENPLTSETYTRPTFAVSEITSM
jgi:hypothetical protein